MGEKPASTFLNDQHRDERFDYIMANPPFNLKNWREEDDLKNDERWQGYKVPPVSNANYAWILNILSKLSVNGIAGFLLANGALQSPEDYENRKLLIENDKVETIIVLPRDMFYSTDISVTLWIINNNKKQQSVNNELYRDRRHEFLFIDLRTWNTEKSEDKYVILTEQQITKVNDIYMSWKLKDGKYKDVPELTKSVGIEDIRNKDYSLAPSKYIEFIDHDLNIDFDKEMKRIQVEVANLLKEEDETKKKLLEAFKGIGYEIKEVDNE